jgi:hypothetical protein
MEALSIKLLTTFDSHYYDVYFTDGTIECFPSSTTILKAWPEPGLTNLRERLGKYEADRAMERGRLKGIAVHGAAEAGLNGSAIIYDNGMGSITEEELKHYQNNYFVTIIKNQEEFIALSRIHDLFELWQPEFLGTEIKVFSFAHKFAGTVDIIMRLKKGEYYINGGSYKIPETGVYIVDIKSGSFVGDSAFFQTASYAWAAIESGVINQSEFQGTIILHTNSTAKKGIEGLSVKIHDVSEVADDFEVFKDIYRVWKRSPLNKGAQIRRDLPNVLIFNKSKKII